ncbi:MAG: integrase [Granulosicoccus sp.]|jgi:integrase
MSVPLKASEIIMSTFEVKSVVPWNKGKLVGQKLPIKLKEIWSIRVRLQLATNRRELALFNLAIDSKLRGSDLVKMKVSDISKAGIVSARAMVLQQKTGRPVQFEITEQTREAISDWMASAKLSQSGYLFPTRLAASKHLSTRQYARVIDSWVTQIRLDSSAYGTHSLRRTKPTLIYKRTKNLCAIQLLLGHTKPESTFKYLGIEVDDALEIAEQTEI